MINLFKKKIRESIQRVSPKILTALSAKCDFSSSIGRENCVEPRRYSCIFPSRSHRPLFLRTCGTTITKMEPLLSSVNSPRAFSRGDENPSKGTREKVRVVLLYIFHISQSHSLRTSTFKIKVIRDV